MKLAMKYLVLGAALPLMLFGDLSSTSPLGLSLSGEAHAIIGRPLTPFSYAGVARRTTARFVAADATAVTATAVAATEAQQQAIAQQQATVAAQQQAQFAAQPAGAPAIGTIVSSLPAGCVSAPKGGVEYFNCSGVYYRTAFQGNNLVYVVQQP